MLANYILLSLGISFGTIVLMFFYVTGKVNKKLDREAEEQMWRQEHDAR